MCRGTFTRRRARGKVQGARGKGQEARGACSIFEYMLKEVFSCFGGFALGIGEWGCILRSFKPYN